MKVVQFLSEEGRETKKYYYDKKTKTYFSDIESIEKSREYETFNEVLKLINPSMEDAEKYKILYDYMVNKFNYNYKVLEGEKLLESVRLLHQCPNRSNSMIKN